VKQNLSQRATNKKQHINVQRQFVQHEKNLGSDITHSSHPSVSLSFVDITGSTRLSAGICDTRENKKIAASNDWKNMRAPAKKKFPMLQG